MRQNVKSRGNLTIELITCYNARDQHFVCPYLSTVILLLENFHKAIFSISYSQLPSHPSIFPKNSLSSLLLCIAGAMHFLFVSSFDNLCLLFYQFIANYICISKGFIIDNFFYKFNFFIITSCPRCTTSQITYVMTFFVRFPSSANNGR